MAQFTWPPISVTASSGPTQFNLNGVATEVSQDTVTPASSIPLPVKVLDSTGVAADLATETTLAAFAGAAATETTLASIESLVATEATLSAIEAQLPATLGQKAMAQSLAVTLASDQSALAVSATNLDIRDLTSASDSVAAVQSGNWAVRVQDGAGNAIGSTSGALDVNITGGGGANGSVSATGAAVPTDATYVAGVNGGNLVGVGVTATGEVLVEAAQLPAALGQATMANSLAVVLASNQSAIPVTSGGNANGSYAEITNLTTVAQTLSVPANAVGFLLGASSDNSNNVRWRIGSVATTTGGMRLEPGRDTGYMPCAANISVIAEAGTNQSVTIQWVLSV